MDSDSSEDENLKHLQEAVVADFFSDNLYKNDSKETVKEPQKEKSLRISKTEDNTHNNFLNLTPGIQSFIAKQLENFLETSLSKQLTDTAENNTRKRRKRTKNRVRLLSDSKHFINLEDENIESSRVVNNNRPKPKADFDSEDEEKIKMVLVEPEDIISKKEVLNWAKSTRTKQIFRYKKSKKGNMLLEL